LQSQAEAVAAEGWFFEATTQIRNAATHYTYHVCAALMQLPFVNVIFCGCEIVL
jgi:hypothetical protein